MVSSSQIATIAIAAVIAVTLFSPIHGAIADNVGEVEIENEEWTAELGEAQNLDGYDVVENSETIEYDDAGAWVELTEGDDYEIDYDSGEVTILEGNVAGVEDGDTIRASYTYNATDGTTATVAGIVPLLVVLLILITIARPIMSGNWG